MRVYTPPVSRSLFDGEKTFVENNFSPDKEEPKEKQTGEKRRIPLP